LEIPAADCFRFVCGRPDIQVLIGLRALDEASSAVVQHWAGPVV